MTSKMTRLIQKTIRESGLPLMEIAARAGISHGQLSRFMRGERTLTLPIAERVCDVLGLELRRVQNEGRHQIAKPKKERNSARDYTKFDVEIGGQRHECLSKRSAVLTIVKYLCAHGATPEAIENAGRPPKDRKMFQLIDGATRFDETRWFCDEPIISRGKTYIFTNQWGRLTIPVINKLKEKFPDARIRIAESR